MIAALFALTLATAHATAPAEEPRWRVDAEWAASLALFGGFGLEVGFKPPTKTEVRFGVGGFALRLPEFGLGENEGEGWRIIDRSAFANAQIYAGAKRGGLFGGLTGLVQQRVLEKTGEVGTAEIVQLIVAPSIGYEWFPVREAGFYVSPSFVLALRVAELGEPEVGDARFVEGPVLALPGIDLGWEF